MRGEPSARRAFPILAFTCSHSTKLVEILSGLVPTSLEGFIHHACWLHDCPILNSGHARTRIHPLQSLGACEISVPRPWGVSNRLVVRDDHVWAFLLFQDSYRSLPMFGMLPPSS